MVDALLARSMPPLGEKRDLPRRPSEGTRRADANEPCKQCPDCGEYCACLRSRPDYGTPRNSLEEKARAAREAEAKGTPYICGCDYETIVRRAETTLPDSARRAANDLLDAISNPKGRDFDPAWEEACMFFGRFGAPPTRLAKLAAVAEAARLYVADDDEDRVQTWDAMVAALDDALEALTSSQTGSDEP